jgi:hypothetical protein
MSCFNEDCFVAPKRPVTLAWALTGLLPWYIETRLIPGTTLWRMGSSATPWERNATSPWWISQDTLDYLVNTAELIAGEEHRMDRTFRRLARMKLAVLSSWSDQTGQHDLVVQAVLRGRARVLHGRGRFVEDNKDNVHYRALGAFEIEQVFLPGLSFPETGDPGNIAHAKRTITPNWRDHVEVRQFKASSFFAM